LTFRIGPEAEEAFSQLPPKVRRGAIAQFKLIRRFPRLGAVRRRGVCRGLRYIQVEAWLFYYRFSSTEIELLAVLPGRMEEA